MEIEKIKDQFNQVAQKYDEQRRFFIPCFDDFYQTGIAFLSKIHPDFKSILDLGTGTGLLAMYLYEKYPEAKYTLIDASDSMLDVARQRFKNLDNFNLAVADYSMDFPSGKYDLVTSALSIHHMEEDAKAALYSSIYNILPENGCFLNLDQFNASTDLMNDFYNEYWYDSIKQSGIQLNDTDTWLRRRELDKENTIRESMVLLRENGFKNVECIYAYMKFGVILAIK